MKLIPNKIKRTVASQSLKLHKSSPRLLFIGGMVGVVGGGILACRATLKLNETLDDFKAEVDDNKENAEPRDMAYIYVKNTAKIAALYTPAIVVGGAGLACLTGSHLQLSHRNTALTAAYATISSTLAGYRDRVAIHVGDETEHDLYHGIAAETVIDEDGKKRKVKTIDPNKLSGYAKIFDEYNWKWVKDAEMNRVFIQCQQSYLNNILQVRGHVFLNEVYDQLGFEHTSPGSIVGWVIGNGDNYIDFGLFNPDSAPFINNEERSIVLDFNVDGVIYDLID